MPPPPPPSASAPPRAAGRRSPAAGLDLSLPAAGGGAVYAAIRDQIAERIAAGTLGDGARLPPVRGLARSLGVNQMTVARAYGDLAERGLVEGRRGGGTYVRAPAPDGRGVPARTAATGAEPWQDPRSLSRRLFDLARTPGTIAFTGNYPDPETADCAGFRAALSELLAGDTDAFFRYDPPEGRPELQRALGPFLARWGLGAGPEETIVVSGGQQGLDIVARAVLRPGDTVAIERPAYFGAITALTAAGSRVVEIPVQADGLDVDALARAAARQRLRLVYVNPTFQNPTGATLSMDKRRALLDLASRYGFAILEDDHGPELRFAGEPLPPLHALADGRVPVFYTRGFGKVFVPGIRLGVLLVPPERREACLAVKALSDLQSNALLQGALARWLEAGRWEAAADRLAVLYAGRQGTLVAALRERLPEGCLGAVPAGGLSLWLTLPDGLDGRELYFHGIREGVAFAAGENFFVADPDHRHVRLSFGLLSEPQIVAGVARLAAVVGRLGRAGSRAPAGA